MTNKEIWPDSLELEDEIEYNGDKYEVVGTGPGEAMIEKISDSSITGEVFRWAFTDAVGIEIEASFEQEGFEKMVNRQND